MAILYRKICVEAETKYNCEPHRQPCHSWSSTGTPLLSIQESPCNLSQAWTTNSNGCLSLADLSYIELRQRLSVASLSAVVLLPMHLEDCQFWPLQILYYFRLHDCVVQVGLSNAEFAIIFDCQHTAELYRLTRLCLQSRKDPVQKEAKVPGTR